MQIKTISSITIADSGVGIRLHKAALRQGDLDGACGPYSLIMALILSEVLRPNQALKLWSGDLDKRTTFAKFVNDHDALVTNGMSADDLKSLFLSIQRLVGTQKINKLVMSTLVSDSDENENGLKGVPLLTAVKEHIDTSDRPVLLTLEWPNNASHWVLAIGYQCRFKNGKQELENILTLDPDAETGKINAWNGVLGQGMKTNKRLRYTKGDGVPKICSATLGVGFKTKN